MRYQVINNFKVKKSQGEMELKVGQIITLSKDNAVKLLNEGKITFTEKAACKVYSGVLGCYLWVMDTDQDIHPLMSRGVPEAIYSHDEIKKLRELSREDLKNIHKIKETFENSKIEEVKRKCDADRRDTKKLN